MNWSADEQRGVANALLGSWPGTMTAWGREAFAAYVAELQARGLSAESVLIAIRSWPAGSDFPPSAPNLAAAARKDPSAPTFEEAYALIYNPRGILWGRSSGQSLERARDGSVIHPLVGSFAVRYGIERLRLLEVDHPEFGGLKRKELRQAWEAHVAATEGRDLVALMAPRSAGSLRQLDPLAALSGVRDGQAQLSTRREQ